MSDPLLILATVAAALDAQRAEAQTPYGERKHLWEPRAELIDGTLDVIRRLHQLDARILELRGAWGPQNDGAGPTLRGLQEARVILRGEKLP